MVTEKRGGRRLQSEPATYEIVVQGSVNARWADWLGQPEALPDGDESVEMTKLYMCVPDQAALLGHLQKLADLGYPLLLVRHVAWAQSNGGNENEQ